MGAKVDCTRKTNCPLILSLNSTPLSPYSRTLVPHTSRNTPSTPLPSLSSPQPTLIPTRKVQNPPSFKNRPRFKLPKINTTQYSLALSPKNKGLLPSRRQSSLEGRASKGMNEDKLRHSFSWLKRVGHSSQHSQHTPLQRKNTSPHPQPCKQQTIFLTQQHSQAADKKK